MIVPHYHDVTFVPYHHAVMIMPCRHAVMTVPCHHAVMIMPHYHAVIFVPCYQHLERLLSAVSHPGEPLCELGSLTFPTLTCNGLQQLLCAVYICTGQVFLGHEGAYMVHQPARGLAALLV